MPTRPILPSESRLFARWLNQLLNGTVCTGVRLECQYHKGSVEAYISSGRRGPVPLSIDGRKPRGHLILDYLIGADTSRRFLAVKSSYVGLFRDAARTEPLLHYDFERDKPHGYPEAHVQIYATSGPWARLTEKSLSKLHLPVGGRRFRPILEDLIELLIVEELVDARPGWHILVEQGRARYRQIQLAAAMRSDPKTAVDIVHDLDLPA